MAKVDMVIFDLDGTAIDSPDQKLPSERLIAAVRTAEEKYILCAATGRPWSFAAPVLQALGLKDACIIAGGARICDPQSGEVLWQATIDNAAAQAALEVLRKYPTYKLLCNDYVEADYTEDRGAVPQDFIMTEPIYFLEQTYIPESIAPEINAQLEKIDGITSTLVVAQRDGQNDIHITAQAATKEHAVGELLRMLGVEQRFARGIGDGHNDIHLFRAVGRKIAIGNAVPDLKAEADFVIGDVRDDGLAAYLEELVSYG